MKVKTKRRGRRPAEKNIIKVKEYRAKGLSYREICRIMKKHVSQIHRWDSYDVVNE